MANDPKAKVIVNLDSPMDDIDDLPGFLVFPSGAYTILLAEGLVEKEVGEHPGIEMAMTLKEIHEFTDSVQEEEKPKVGDVCSTVFMLDNATGAGMYKEVLKVVGGKLGMNLSKRELNAQSKGLECLVILKKTYDKDKDRHYCNLKKMSVL